MKKERKRIKDIESPKDWRGDNPLYKEATLIDINKLLQELNKNVETLKFNLTKNNRDNMIKTIKEINKFLRSLNPSNQPRSTINGLKELQRLDSNLANRLQTSYNTATQQEKEYLVRDEMSTYKINHQQWERTLRNIESKIEMAKLLFYKHDMPSLLEDWNQAVNTHNKEILFKEPKKPVYREKVDLYEL